MASNEPESSATTCNPVRYWKLSRKRSNKPESPKSLVREPPDTTSTMSQDIQPIPSSPLRTQFVRTNKFEKDIAVLYSMYIIEAIPQLRQPLRLLQEILEESKSDTILPLLERSAKFTLRLGVFFESRPDRSADEVVPYFTEILQSVKEDQSHGVELEIFPSRLDRDLATLHPDSDSEYSQSGGAIIDILTTERDVFDLVTEAVRLSPIPLVDFAVKGVLTLFQCRRTTNSHYDVFDDIAFIAGDFVLSLAAVCAQYSSEAPSKLSIAVTKFAIKFKEVTGVCHIWSKLYTGWDFEHNFGMRTKLEKFKTDLVTAIECFQQSSSWVSVQLKSDDHTSEIYSSNHILGNLPIHPRYPWYDYLPGSQDIFLRQISARIEVPGEPIFWLQAPAGLGKSTVAQELVRILRSQGRLAGGIFLASVASERPEIVIQMISRQLGELHRKSVASISRAIEVLTGPHVPLEDYLKRYIIDPILEMKYPYYLAVVIDGLDAWSGTGEFLKALKHIPSPSPVKFVLSSRPDRVIEQQLEKVKVQCFALRPVPQKIIEEFFENHFQKLDWIARIPEKSIVSRLSQKAQGLLIWAATVCSIISCETDDRNPRVILDQILSGEEKVGCRTGEQLECLYRDTLISLFPDSETRSMRGHLRRFLGASSVLRESLTCSDFALLLGMHERPIREIQRRLMKLQSSGEVTVDPDLVVPASGRFHASFLEFVQTAMIGSDTECISETEFNSHATLAKGCLDLVFSKLLSSNQGESFTSFDLSKVESYAVKFWPFHVSSGTPRTPEEKSSLLDEVLKGVSDISMRRWARLFLSSISVNTDHADDLLNEARKEEVLYRLAIILEKDDEAIVWYQVQCLEVAVRLHQDNERIWETLGRAYHKLHGTSRCCPRYSLDQSIISFRRVLQLRPNEGSSREDILEHFAGVLLTRFRQYGEPADLEESMGFLRQILGLHSGRFFTKKLLVTVLLIRFQSWGYSNELNEAINLNKELLEDYPHPSPERVQSLSNLGCAYTWRFKSFGNLEDLHKAMQLNRDALMILDEYPDCHPFRASIQANFGFAMYSRFEQWGAITDLEEAMGALNEACDLFPEQHADHLQCRISYAVAMRAHFQKVDESGDLEKIITILRDFAFCLPMTHPLRGCLLETLATCLKVVFEVSGDDSRNLEEAIYLYQDALVLQPTCHPYRSTTLTNFASALQLRDGPRDVVEAIILLREAASLQLGGHPDRFKTLRDLSRTLRFRSEKEGTTNYLYLLDDAISLLKEAIDICPKDHQMHPDLLKELSGAPGATFEQD